VAPRPQSAASRARRAQERLRMCGGGDALPLVLTSHDAIACLGRAWFHYLLRRNALPGVQVTRFGVWRCARETSLTWLAEVANEVALPTEDVASAPARNVRAMRTTAGMHCRSAATCERRDSASVGESRNDATAIHVEANDSDPQ